MQTELVQTDLVLLTPAAADAVRDLFVKRNLENYGLRIFISGGGCSGFQYGLALEDNIHENDLTYEMNGVRMVVDEVSIDYLRGASIDYVDELMGSGFKITNPNAVSTCGCGNSFRTSNEDSSAGGGCSSCS
jgi:iron-sulfur cluster assembly accessory protein